MSLLDWFIDARFLSGIGLGFLITTYGMLTLLGNNNNQANTAPQMKLSSKRLPTISELKKAYQKQPKKNGIEEKQQNYEKKDQDHKKSRLMKSKKQDEEEDQIRKKVKLQYHQFDPFFEENRSQKSLSNFESADSSVDQNINKQSSRFKITEEPDLDEIINFAEMSSKIKGRQNVNVELFPHEQDQKALFEEEIIE